MRDQDIVKFLLPAAAAVAAGLIALAGASSAHDERGDGRNASIGQCVSEPLDDSRILDDKTLLLTDGHGDAAILTMTTACLSERDKAVGITFRGTSEICHPIDADITGGVGGVPEPCIVDTYTPISMAEARAYENRKSER